MKLNKQRQKMYLDGNVGLINDGTVEQLREVCRYGMFKGDVKYYTQKHHGHKEQFTDIEYHPIAWFYEETELPKRVKYLDKVWDVINKVKNLYSLSLPDKSVSCFAHVTECTPITETTPSTYKLNIDIPEWLLKAGDKIEAGRLPRSIIQHIATPCTTFTLENGTQIELTANDIDKIKKL